MSAPTPEQILEDCCEAAESADARTEQILKELRNPVPVPAPVVNVTTPAPVVTVTPPNVAVHVPQRKKIHVVVNRDSNGRIKSLDIEDIT